MKKAGKETVDGLRERVRLSGIICDALPEGIIFQDSGGRILYANSAASRILGVGIERLTGTDFLDPRWRAVHENGSPFSDQEDPGKAALRSGRSVTDVVMGILDPERDCYRWIKISAHPQIGDESPGVSGVLTVISDITEQRRSEKNFQDILARLRRSQEIALVGDWSWDIVSDIVTASEEALRQMGFPADYRPRFSEISECIHPDDRAAAAEKLKEAMRTGNPYTTEFRIHRKVTGELRYIVSMGEIEIDDQQKPVRVFGINQDITERKAAEEALRRSEEKYRLIFDYSPLGLFSFDEEGTIVACNDRFVDILGSNRQQLIGLSMLDLPDEKLVVEIRKAISGDIGNYEDIYKAVTSGKSIPLRAVFAPAVKGGIVSGGIGIIEDISERWAAEEALKENRSFLTDLIENSGSLIYVKDRKGGYVFVNRKWEEATGLTRESVLGLTDKELFAVEIAEKFQRNDTRVIETGQAAEYEEVLPNGVRERFFISIKFPLRGGGDVVTGVCGMSTEITDRKAAEEMLRDSETRYREVFELSVDGISIVSRDGKVRAVNKAFCDMLGIPASDFLGKDFTEIPFDPGSVQEVPFRLELLDKGRIVNAQRILIGVDGKKVNVDMRTKKMPDGNYQTVFRDITDHKAAEDALRNSESRFRELFDLAVDGILLGTHEGVIMGANQAFCDMLGVPAEEITGKHIGDIGFIEGELAENPLRFDLLQQGHVVGNQRTLVRPDGTRVCIDMRTKMMPDGTYQSFFRDITERKQAEKEREKLQDQLMQSQKMESVGRLAGGVAHDFNNMLGVILGYVDMSLVKIEKEHPLFGYMQQIRRAAERSSNLTRQLLAFARKQTILPKVLNLNATVAGMLEILGRLIGENIELIWRPGEDLMPVLIDPGQVDQILANLSVNSRDAIGGNGRIVIETENTTIDDAVGALFSGARPGRYVRLTVTDNGCGMDQVTQSHLFEPFFTTKKTGEGTGLGLATVYGIVRQNNGFVSVYSEPGQGTSIKIHFPGLEGETELGESVKESFRDDLHEKGAGTILLVEDEPAILDMTVLMLRELGYTVLPAATPGQAIEKANEYPDPIDLLITDVVMPEMNGRDLAKKVLDIHPHMKRLFMSGYTAEVIAFHGVLDEGVNFMQKPFTITELSAKVSEVLLNA